MMSASRRYKVRPCHIKTQDFTGYCGRRTKVDSVCYGASWAQKQRAHGPVPRPAPLNGLGRGVFFRVALPPPPTPPIP